MTMKRPIQENIYPRWDSFANQSMEKMVLLFADMKKGHASVGNPEKLENYFKFGKRAESEYDWVQLHSGYFFDHVPLKKYPDCQIQIDETTNQFIDRTIEICKRNNKKVCYMMGDYAPLQPILDAYPEVKNLNNGLFWELLYDTACGIFERFPGLDEIGMYFFESKNLLHYNNFFGCMNYGLEFKEEILTKRPDLVMAQEGQSYPYLSFGDHLRMMMMAVSKACRDKGKSFTVLTHAWFPYQEEVLYEALKDFPSDLPILLEHNYTTGDFNPYLPAPRLIKRLPHMNHGLCFCCGMEYHGLSVVPCCFPEAMQETIHDAMESSPNLKRIVMRPMWDGQDLLGTPNEVNPFYLLKAAKHPEVDTEEVWQEWLEMRYGLNTAEDKKNLAAALRTSYKIVKNVFFEFGVRTNDHSHIPDFEHLESRLYNYGKALIKWSPTPENKQTIYDLLIHPGEKILRMHRELHEESLELYQKAIEKVNKVSKDLKEEDRQDILERFQRMQVWIELHQEEYEAYIRLLIHRKKPQMENKEAALEALKRLEEKAQDIRTGKVSDCYLFSLDHIDSFVQTCRKKFEE